MTLTGNARAPLDVVCVIDVSGSMNAAAELKTASGETESFGLSVRQDCTTPFPYLDAYVFEK